MMQPTRIYPNISPEIWACIRAKSMRVYATVYSPMEGNKGTATTVTMGQKVVLGFDFDPDAGTLTYTIVSKGMLVPEKAIWNGIQDNISACTIDANR